MVVPPAFRNRGIYPGPRESGDSLATRRHSPTSHRELPSTRNTEKQPQRLSAKAIRATAVLSAAAPKTAFWQTMLPAVRALDQLMNGLAEWQNRHRSTAMIRE
jgi:hypothetical protein